ncbi:MAG: ABC transporter ATP-binding protein [Pseudomonadota bacterium]
MLSRLIERLTTAQSVRLIGRLLRETAWEHRWAYAAAIALMAIVAAMGAAIAYTIEDVINNVFIDRRQETVQAVAFLVLGIFVVRGAAMYGQMVLLSRIGNRIVAKLQARLYDHMLAQGLALHNAETTGDLSTRITHNAQSARAALHLMATRLGADLMSVIGFVGVMIYQDAQLTLLAFLGLPVIFGGIALLVNRVKKLARAEVVIHGQILSTMGETAAGARIIRAFGLEDRMRGTMRGAIEGVRDRADRIAILQGAVNPLMETMAGIAAAAVILYAGWRIIQGGTDVGTFVSFLAALIMAGDPARRLGHLSVAIRQHLAGVEAIFALLDRHAEIPEPPDAPALSVTRGEIRFTGVHFAYADTPALAGFDMVARPGEVTALVGPSGAGKSTVLDLIERFHDPDRGHVAIDGQDLVSVSVASLRAQIALVTQQTFLFDASIADNIRLGSPAASPAEIERAARDANADDFIAELPQGYATPLGEAGGRLSGGQRQRIAIARAMLRDAPILLLDEATSALDAEAEARVAEALDRLMKGRTTIVIAHRLATVRRAHHICVVDKGRVVQAGTHQSLVAEGGLYGRLAALQFGPEKERA